MPAGIAKAKELLRTGAVAAKLQEVTQSIYNLNPTVYNSRLLTIDS
jgi:anthranilate phosphoribosyltransferase